MENLGLFWTDTPWNKFVKELSPFIEEILEQNNGLVIRGSYHYALKLG